MKFEMGFRKNHDCVPAAASSSMRPSASLLLGILIGASCWTAAHGNPVYSVTGVAVGSRVNVDSNAFQEYRCGASEVFDGLTLCVKRTDDTESRGPFIAYAPEGPRNFRFWH